MHNDILIDRAVPAANPMRGADIEPNEAGVKDALQDCPQDAAFALESELNRMELPMESTGDRTWVLNGRWRVCATAGDPPFDESHHIAGAGVRQRGLALGVVADFRRDLLVDGLEVIGNGSD